MIFRPWALLLGLQTRSKYCCMGWVWGFICWRQWWSAVLHFTGPVLLITKIYTTKENKALNLSFRFIHCHKLPKNQPKKKNWSVLYFSTARKCMTKKTNEIREKLFIHSNSQISINIPFAFTPPYAFFFTLFTFFYTFLVPL